MKRYYLKLITTVVTFVLIATVYSVADTGKKVQSHKVKTTVVKQKEQPATPTTGNAKQPSTQTTIEESRQPQLPSPAEPAAGERINWLVISQGGVTQSSSTNYNLGLTVGQNAAGMSSSPGYRVNLGFWQDFALACCRDRGNADGIQGPFGPIDVADVTYLVAMLWQGGPDPPCIEEGNADGLDGPFGPIDVADLTYLIAYLWQGGPHPPPCQ